QFWATATIKKVNDVVQLQALIDGKKVVVTEDVIRQDLHLDDADGKFLIHTLVQCVSAKRTAWNVFIFSMASAIICLATVDDLTSHNTKYTSPALTQKVFVNMRRVEEDDDILTAPTPPTPTNAPSSPLQDPIPTPPPAQPATPHATPPQEQPTATFISFMSLLNTLMETCATLSQKGRIDQDVSAATKDVSAAEPTVFDDEKVTMTMAQKLIKMKAKKAKLLDEQIAQRFHDEEIKKDAARDKQEKDDLERAQALQKQYDDKEENIDWNAIAEQILEKHLDNIRKYQSLKKKPDSIAQARKNMIIYLKNMAGYKMEHFRGMNYDKVKPIFEREYKKVQTLFKPDKDVEEPTKKIVAKETLFQESFKKLKAVKVSGSDSTQETPSNDTKEMSKEDVKNILEIVPVFEFKVEALQVKYPIIDWEILSEGSRIYWKIIRVGGIIEAYQSFKDILKGFDKEDLVALWSLVKEKFSSAVPNVDKEKALWVELKRLFKPNAEDVLWKFQRYMHYPITWKLYTNYGVHQVSSRTRRHDMFMLTEKDYPLSNGVMTQMLSAKLQVEEDSDMARDLVMKIFMKANKLKSRSLDISSK
nr:hypothetical protein [Tanacetum cinerariifolium]